jgi:hypothetical protein
MIGIHCCLIDFSTARFVEKQCIAAMEVKKTIQFLPAKRLSCKRRSICCMELPLAHIKATSCSIQDLTSILVTLAEMIAPLLTPYYQKEPGSKGIMSIAYAIDMMAENITYHQESLRASLMESQRWSTRRAWIICIGGTGELEEEAG